MDRDTRFIRNTTQSLMGVEEQPSLLSMIEGQIVIAQDKYTKKVSLSVKKKGKIHKVYLSSDGDQHVDKALITDELKYKRKFTDHRFFIHNFNRDIGTSETYLPWYDGAEGSDMNTSSTAFLAPYNMTIHKIVVRPETISDTSADLTFTLDKQDDGDTTVDEVATARYSTTTASDTFITIDRSDFTADPTVEAGDKIGLSLTASADPSGAIDWYITSVWETEIII